MDKEVVAGPRHGHFHKKRELDIVTDWDVVYDTVDWDVVYDTVTDVVWVTVTFPKANADAFDLRATHRLLRH